jgi:tRNA(His) 5'-end guanylyltransferase
MALQFVGNAIGKYIKIGDLMSQDNSDIGDRMKLYEQAEAGRRLMPLAPAVARLDGKGFHNWTADLNRPYDDRLSNLMQDLTSFLVDQSCAHIGYTQSDEISLIFGSDKFECPIFFDGKIQKITSVLASMATAFFNKHAALAFFPIQKPLAFFDCRVWNVPNKIEATNALLWREQDATKNSISMLARAYFEHRDLHGKSGEQMQEMLFQKFNINWNDCPDFFKRGSYFRRCETMKELTDLEWLRIPEAHRPAKGTKIPRSEVRHVPMPKFSTIVNRTEVIFDGADPKTATS